MKLDTITHSGEPPSRWAQGLSVMLEKVAGNALINKLCAILLYEGDYNYHSTLIFGWQMMALGHRMGIFPNEIYSEKGNYPDDSVLQTMLLLDRSRRLQKTDFHFLR